MLFSPSRAEHNAFSVIPGVDPGSRMGVYSKQTSYTSLEAGNRNALSVNMSPSIAGAPAASCPRKAVSEQNGSNKVKHYARNKPSRWMRFVPHPTLQATGHTKSA